MIQKCKFDKNRDRGVVLQGLAPDKNEMITKNTVPDNSAEVTYNQLDDIESVGCRISDTFDAIMMQRAIAHGASERKGKKGSQEVSPVSAPSGAESPKDS